MRTSRFAEEPILGILKGTEAASRVIQGGMTGVGLIGAGVITRESQAQQVHGLTTAARIWTCGLLGVSKPLEDRLERSLARRRSASTES